MPSQARNCAPKLSTPVTATQTLLLWVSLFAAVASTATVVNEQEKRVIIGASFSKTYCHAGEGCQVQTERVASIAESKLEEYLTTDMLVYLAKLEGEGRVDSLLIRTTYSHQGVTVPLLVKVNLHLDRTLDRKRADKRCRHQNPIDFYIDDTSDVDFGDNLPVLKPAGLGFRSNPLTLFSSPMPELMHDLGGQRQGLMAEVDLGELEGCTLVGARFQADEAFAAAFHAGERTPVLNTLRKVLKEVKRKVRLEVRAHGGLQGVSPLFATARTSPRASETTAMRAKREAQKRQRLEQRSKQRRGGYSRSI